MTVAVKPSKHAAPGQYLGYALQPVRLCYYLLSSPPESSVSLEHADDVAVHNADGSVKYEQTKSALSHNPLSNYSDDLWKTIAIWVEGITSGAIQAGSSTFSLYVTPAWQGEWASQMDAAQTLADVEKLVGTIAADIGKLKKRPGCAQHTETFLNAAPDVQLALIGKMRVVSDNDPVDPIRSLLAPTVAPELMDLVCGHALGQSKEQADRLLRGKTAALLHAGAFQEEFRAFVRTNNLPNLLVSVATKPRLTELAAVLSDRPTFVRQLELIEATEQQQLRAISDFLRTSADKAHWAESGVIFENDLETWEDDLIRRFEFIRSEVSDIHGQESPCSRGRTVYVRCAASEVRMTGREVPGHFVHGSYTSLADLLRLGWHPDFAALVEKGN